MPFRLNNRDRFIFLTYLVGVLWISWIHDPVFLTGLLGILIFLTGREIRLHAVRVGRGIFFFNFSVSAGWISYSFFSGRDPWPTILLLNLRVLDLALASSLIVEKADLQKALSFSRTLRALVTMSIAQIQVYRRIYEEFQLAYESRSIRPTGFREPVRFIHARLAYFLIRALQDSEETGRALVSRGYSVD